MMTSTRWTLSSWMFGFALLDQISKWLARAALAPQHPMILVPKVFQLTIAYNTGAAFSMLNEQPQLLTLVTTLIFVILLAYGLGRTRFLPGEVPAFSLILGGALGNLTDRFLWGRVTDFLDVVAIHYPIFNLADTLIFVGVALLIYAHLKPYPVQEALDEAPIREQRPSLEPPPKLSETPLQSQHNSTPSESAKPSASVVLPFQNKRTPPPHEPS